MPNLHNSGPDTLAELESIDFDLLPACILSTGGLTTPGSGLTLAAVSATGYVRLGTALYYVSQPAISVTVSSTVGNHWLALSSDTFSAIAGWTRRAGSHFVEQATATQPTAPDGAQLVAQITVTAGNVTVVTAIPSPPLSRQNANNVAITGGGAQFTSPVLATRGVQVDHDPADNRIAFYGLQNAGGTNRWNLYCPGTANNYLAGPLWLATAIPPTGSPSARLVIAEARGSIWGIIFQTSGDGGGSGPMQFRNASNVEVGYITTNATTTTYATASDVRLKRAVQALSGALDAIRALRPVSYLWNADDSVGHGFLAHELQQVIPDAVMGEPDAVNADGSVKPQGVDHSKLVPWLTAALKETLAQVEALTARVLSLEEQLGV